MQVNQFQLASLAPTSRRSYEATWSKWSKWCHDKHISAKLPRTKSSQSELLFEFATYLFNHPSHPNSAASIQSKISAISWCHQASFGYVIGFSPRHRIALEGMARSRVSDERSDPITPAMLRSYYRTTPRLTQRDHAIWGSMVVAFFFCLRVSEYASTPAKTNHYMCYQDVSFTDKNGNPAVSLGEAQSVHLFFRSSKKDQAKRGCTRNLDRSGHPDFCPVIAAWSLRVIGQEMGLTPISPFCSFTDHRHIHRQISVAIISKAVRTAAYNHGDQRKILVTLSPTWSSHRNVPR